MGAGYSDIFSSETEALRGPSRFCYALQLQQLGSTQKVFGVSRCMSPKTSEKCNTRPLSERITVARWKMFGHILRSQSNAPAMMAIKFALFGTSDMKGRRGRHQTNLLNVLKGDLRERGLDFSKDFNKVMTLALDRSMWKRLTHQRV
eukprot:sb/3473774/